MTAKEVFIPLPGIIFVPLPGKLQAASFTKPALCRSSVFLSSLAYVYAGGYGGYTGEVTILNVLEQG